MNAVIYARYSSDSQREESIEGQLRECKAYCEKHDITIVGTYIDRALSAKTDDRPDFRKMIKDSEKKQFELVVVWKLDRFSRNRADSAKYKTILGINGVKVVSATENISSGAEGILLESVLEGLAEYYSADLSEKVKRGQTENALKCKFNGGTIPLGFMVSDDQHLVINPAEAPLVKEIFHRFNNGESMSDIAEDFKRRGIKNRNGRNFYVNTIGNVLRNRRNIGEYRYRDIVVQKGIPAIIDDDEFENAQKRLAQYRHAPAKGKATEEYLLSTKLFCGTCKRMMVGESGKSRNGTIHYYYKCRGNKKYKDCDRKAVKKHWIEDLVVEQTRKNILENTKVIEKIADDIISIQEKENLLLPALKAQLEDCDKKISNLIRAVEDGLYNEHTKARMDELDQQRTKLLLNIAEEEIKMPKYTKDDILAWIRQFQRGNPKSFRYKKRLIDLFVNAVYIYDDRIVFVYNYKSGTDTVMLKDIEAVLGSDFQNVSPPITAHTRQGMSCNFFEVDSNRGVQANSPVDYLPPRGFSAEKRIHPLPPITAHTRQGMSCNFLKRIRTGASKQTVRWTVCRPAAFPQKSESTLSHQKKGLQFCKPFFNEINPCRICEMPFGREIRLRRVKCLRAWGFISFHFAACRKISQFVRIISHRAKRRYFTKNTGVTLWRNQS